jgi:hypothetical protein
MKYLIPFFLVVAGCGKKAEIPNDLKAFSYYGMCQLNWTDKNEDPNDVLTIIERKDNFTSYRRISNLASNATGFRDYYVIPGQVYVYRISVLVDTNDEIEDYSNEVSCSP